jgi:hypothetical protein
VIFSRFAGGLFAEASVLFFQGCSPVFWFVFSTADRGRSAAGEPPAFQLFSGHRPSIPPVRDALRGILSTMISDLSLQHQTLFKDGKVRVTMSAGDARDKGWAKKYSNRVAAIITSPPYLNRYDYSRTYALELCLLTVRSHREMVDVRHSLLRSHVESREHIGKEINLPSLDEVLTQLARKDLNNNRLPVMVQGYFEDMNLVIKNMAAALKPGGRVALVVANAQFAGENVPVDLMLSELAEEHGLSTEDIWVTRFKGNSSQQMAIYGRRPVRESIVFWKKNGLTSSTTNSASGISSVPLSFGNSRETRSLRTFRKRHVRLPGRI